MSQQMIGKRLGNVGTTVAICCNEAVAPYRLTRGKTYSDCCAEQSKGDKERLKEPDDIKESEKSIQRGSLAAGGTTLGLIPRLKGGGRSRANQ